MTAATADTGRAFSSSMVGCGTCSREEDRDDRRDRVHRRAAVWKILTELPETSRTGPPQGLGQCPGSDDRRGQKPIFNDLRKAAGGAAELLDTGVDVIEGDLPNVPQLPHDLDIVVHCAGDVSDPPIDQAFTTNVIGTKALLDRMLEAVTDEPESCAGSRTMCTSQPRTRPVGGAGAIPEAPHAHDIDYEAETAAGIAMRDLIEEESRTSAQLAKLRRRLSANTARPGS